MSGPIKMTEKRPLYRGSFDAFGLGVSVSVTQNQRIMEKSDEEIVFVNGAGAQGVESTLWRKDLGRGNAVRIGGPGVTLDPGGGELGTRIVGVGVSHERVAQDGVNNVQVAAEVKVTAKTLGKGVGLAAPAALHAAETLFDTAGSAAAQAFAHGLDVLLPAISAGLAARSVDHAATELSKRDTPRSSKALAVARAIGDVVRVVDVAWGTLISAAAVVGSVFFTWWKASAASRARRAP